MTQIGSTLFSLASLVTSTAERQATVSLHLDVSRSIGGVSKLDRQQYFNVHGGPGSDKQWPQAHVDQFANTFGASLGRAFSASYIMKQVSEDPLRPGYVDHDELSSWCSKHPATLGNWPAESVEMVTVAHPEQYYSGAKGFVPGSHDAAADFWSAFVSSGCAFNSETQRRLILEPMNECAVHASELHTNFSEMADAHAAIGKRLRSDYGHRSQEVLFGGPTAAFPAWQLSGFQKWNDEMGLFIDRAGPNIDFLSVHLYDKLVHSEESDEDIYRSGSNTLAILDMHEAYSKVTLGLDKPIPHLISEYGGGFKMKGLNYTAGHDWWVLKGVIGKVMDFLDRPDRLIKAIPFIVNKASDWFQQEGDASYPFVLFRQEVAGEGPFVPTHLFKFYELMADLPHGAERVSVKVAGDASVQAHAFAAPEQGRAWLLLNNLLANNASVALDVIAESTPTATIKRLFWSDSEAAPVLDVVTGGKTRSIQMQPHETVLMEFSASPWPLAASAEEDTFYATEMLVEFRDANPHTFTVPLHAGLTAADVSHVRVSFGGKDGLAVTPPSLRVAGEGWPYSAAEAIAGYTNSVSTTGECWLAATVPRASGVASSSSNVMEIEVAFPEAALALSPVVSSVAVVTSVTKSSQVVI